MKMLYLDTETCGLHGFAVLIQYAYNDGEIKLFYPWLEPAYKTVELIEEFTNHCFIGFNCNFDWFHLCKLYTTFRLLPPEAIPVENIDLVAELESEARFGPCLKPKSCLDLLLHSRKGPYQCLMDRKDIRIRRVPAILAQPLANVLENTIEFDGILFAKRANKDAPRWAVLDIKEPDGSVNPEFKDVRLKFSPAGGLKVLAQYALKIDPKYLYSEVEIDRSLYPYEKGYIPFAKGLSSKEKGWLYADKDGKQHRTWPLVIEEHIKHWRDSEAAIQYAIDDVVYTRKLYEHFEKPEVGDDDSVLACSVAAVRWRGYDLDLPGVEKLLENDKKVIESAPINVNAHLQVRKYLSEVMDDLEKVTIEKSTDAKSLKALVNTMVIEEQEECFTCFGEGCPRCEGKGYLSPGPTVAAKRAKEVMELRQTGKEIELFEKLLEAKRWHPDFKITGTLSSRMSGGGSGDDESGGGINRGGLNSQGVKKANEIRELFPLKWEGMKLSGGDLSSCEVAIAEAVFKDDNLREDLLSGKKIHAIFGMELFPGMSYEEILATDGTSDDRYKIAKSALFAILYGGDAGTIHRNTGISLPIAEKAFDNFQRRYPGLRRVRDQITADFSAIRQREIGGAVTWHDPKDYIESMLGFKRFFTLENRVIKSLYELSRNTPKEWRSMDCRVVRRDRVQEAHGAVSSALYGAAFQVQAANIRAANNHVIQSFGAMITKRIQRQAWELQPSGVNDWVVCPMQVHDEIMCVTRPDKVDPLADIIREELKKVRKMVPLLYMEWHRDMPSWAEKSDEDNPKEVM